MTLKEKFRKIDDWAILQKSIAEGATNRLPYIFNNSIYFAHLGEGVGSEQSQDRPVLVVDSYKTSSVCIVIPITLERLGDDKEYHVDLECGIGTALTEQIRAISKDRIFTGVKVQNGEYASITESERIAINQQLSNMCRLKPLKSLKK